MLQFCINFHVKFIIRTFNLFIIAKTELLNRITLQLNREILHFPIMSCYILNKPLTIFVKNKFCNSQCYIADVLYPYILLL